MEVDDDERYDETDHGKPVDSVSVENLKRHSPTLGIVNTNGVLTPGLSDDKLMSTTEPEEDVGEAEDGEILEDGEIDDEDEEGQEPGESCSPQHEENTESPQQNEGQERKSTEVDKTDTKKPESESEGGEEELSVEKKKKEKKRRKRHREKDKKKKFKEEGKRKRKRHDYVDFDKAEDEFDYQPKIHRRSPPGPYDSPYESPEEKSRQSPPGPYDSPYKSPPGPYDSPPESPPGPYDSPPEDSDEDDRYGDQNNHRKRVKKSMMGMIDDAYLDPNIAASEKQDIFQGAVRGRNRKGKGMKGMPHPQKKKPLLETPRAARPLCKFYKEGKCAKGTQCPFNHDFTPPKKPEICKFYLNSSCNKGQECIYMHGEYPCKFFHTGAQCFGGDNCKFSHDPLTPETYPLLTKILDNDEEDFQPKSSKPSLLGSPPRHVKEAAERMKASMNPAKKIPSLLDIEVFPPKHSPQKQQNSPNSESASPKSGSMHMRPGFYSETAPQTTYNNPAVVALGALLGAANQSPSGRYPFQSPNSQSFGGDSQQGGADTEESEIENSQDTQKLEDESSQEDQLGIKSEEGISDEDKKPANFEVPSHLPPKQRELFMRIHQQQREETTQAERKKDDDEPVDDDDWYSSDEDESGQPRPKLMDMLKNISQQKAQTPPSNNASQPVSDQQSLSQPKLSDSGTGSFNILQMLNAIRGQGSATSSENQGSVASASQLIESLLPQSAKEAYVKTEPIVKVDKTPPHQSPGYGPMEQLPRVPKDGSELPYKVLSISLNKKLYVPPNLDMSDPRVSNDPRVQKYGSKGGAVKLERQISNKSSSDTEVTENKVSNPKRQHSGSGDSNAPTINPADPRKRLSVKSESPSDPRRASKDSSANTAEDLIADPQLQRAMTELIQSAVAVKQDLRLQKSQSNPAIGMHSLPVRPPVRHGFPMGYPGPPPGVRPMGPGPHRPPGGMPMGPRSGRPPLLRTPIMPDGSFRPRGPRPFVDPRISRQNSNEMHYGPPQGGPRARPPGMSPGRELPNFGPPPNDPRNRSMAPLGNQSGAVPNDPRLRGGMSQNSETSNFPQNPSDPRLRSQGQLTDTKNLRISDPRLERQGGSLDNSSGPRSSDPRSSDPRIHRQTSQPAISYSTVKEENEGEADSNWDNRPLSRLDPRSQTRPGAEPGHNVEPKVGSVVIKKKKFIGQRKGSMEYSSPLGMSSDQPDPAVSGFSHYNRPAVQRQRPANDQNQAPTPQTDPRSKSGYSNSQNYSGYSSPNHHEQTLTEGEQINLPMALQPPLKDLFKTIDPTASPFC